MSATRNQPQGVFRKQQWSKLDPHMPQLLAMCDQGKSIPEMHEWLETLTPSVSTCRDNLRRVMSSRLQRRKHEQLLAPFEDAGKRCHSLDNASAKNPAPEMGIIINLFKSKIMDLAARAEEEPNYLKLADQLTRTAITYLSEQNRSGFKQREVVIKEEKFAGTRQEEQARALELCLDSADRFPAVKELFNAAFAALKQAEIAA